MIIQARRFETIGFLHVSEGIFSEDVATLKSWLELANNQKLFLVIDLNSAEFNPTIAASLKALFQESTAAGIKFNIVIADPTWNTYKTIQMVFQQFNTPESKAIGNALLMEEKARELQGTQADWDSQLVEILLKYGLDLTALDTMKAEDFIKLNHKKFGSQERLLSAYKEAIRVLKLLDTVVSVKKVSAEKVKEIASVKAQILGYLQTKGLN